MTSVAVDPSDREERFKHLLQPIRDLAQNWDVDIATSLEEYLEDLDEITITLDGGASKVNFAEAALLIQGSTCVYSRKVEHVYQLVLRTIEFLTEQKEGNNGAKQAQNTEEDATQSPTEEDSVFLPLDDVLEEGKNIDLPIVSSSRLSMEPHRRTSVGFRGNAGLGGVTLTAPSGENREDRGAAGTFGAVDLKEISRPPMFLMEQDYGNSFKMSTCALHESGALLIEGAEGGSRLSLSTVDPSPRTSSGTSDFWGGLGGLRRQGVGAEVGEAQGGEFTAHQDWGPGDGDMVDSDDDVGDAGFGGTFGGDSVAHETGDGDSRGDPGHPKQGQHMEQRSPKSATPHQGTPHMEGSVSTGGWQLRERGARLQEARNDVGGVKRIDPWNLLDPHDPGSVKARPIRKGGRTYRLPLHLKRPRAATKTDRNCEERMGDTLAFKGATWVSHSGKLIPSVPLHGLAYPEFEYVDKREKQRKALQVRLARRKAREFVGRERFLAETSLIQKTTSATGTRALEESNGMALDKGYISGGSYSDCDSDGGGGIYGDSMGECRYPDFGRHSDDGDYGEANGGGAASTGEDAEGVAPISLEDAFREKPQTYEDLCRSHIEAFMRGTERYAHETQLSRRVGAWQRKLEPIMHRQDKREAFDIHKYGRSVLKSVASLLTPSQQAQARDPKANKGERNEGNAGKGVQHEKSDAQDSDIPPVDFSSVARGKEPFDVCRLFLASLQLANNGNVRLSHGECAAEQASTPFRLELLTLQDAPNMHGYLAPSATLGITPVENAS